MFFFFFSFITLLNYLGDEQLVYIELTNFIKLCLSFLTLLLLALVQGFKVFFEGQLAPEHVPGGNVKQHQK